MIRFPFLSSLLLTCVALCVLGPSALSQSSVGLPTFATVHDSLYDDIKVNDGSILLKLPIRTKAGLIPFSYSLVSNVAVGVSNGGLVQVSPQWTPMTSLGLSPGIRTGWINYRDTFCSSGEKTTEMWDYQFTDGLGASHLALGMRADTAQCLPEVLTGGTNDQSGYSVSVHATGLGPIITDASGNQINPQASIYLNGGGTITDTNGNQLSYTTTCIANCTSGANQVNQTTYTDTTGLTGLTQTTYCANYCASITKDVHSWTDAAGKTQSYTFVYSAYPQKTNFGCVTPGDISSGTLYMPSSITAPDGTYKIYYEGTPQNPGYVTGRISQIVFPSGASTQYSYTGGHNGLACYNPGQYDNEVNSITVPVLTRTLTDTSGVAHKWTYDTTQGANETVVTDPSGNDTVYLFIILNSGTSLTRYPYETQRQIYQGSHTKSSNLLQTVTTCYNGNATNCANAPGGPPFTQKDLYTTFSGMTTSSRVTQFFDGVGNVTRTVYYDFGASSPTRTVDTPIGTYQAGVPCNPIGNQINNRTCFVNSWAGNVGGTLLSSTNFTYDPKGNLSTRSDQTTVSGTAAYLNTSYTYNQNGTLNVVTDVNNAPTTYGNYVCNSNFPTAVSEPLGLSISMSWDCNGGVMETLTDENGKPTTYTYFDPNTGFVDAFYRPISLTDALNNTTNYTYSPTTFESAMNFGTVSTSDALTTTDGFGHQLLAQIRQAQGSSSFDTTPYTYDLNFRSFTVGIPCSAAAGKSCTTPVTTTTYDGLSRPLQVTDAGTGYVSYNHAPGGSQNNDVLVTAGPPPSNENTKRRQLEYDGLGRLTSVCELTSPTNGGYTCGQTTPQTGYWTRYEYDGLGRLTGVCQNTTQPLSVDCVLHPSASQQTRTCTYDGLGRLTSERNPEWGPGTATYIYDHDPNGVCTGTYNGDLVKRVDNAGNISCYGYDALHRKLSTTYSGPNATGTNRYFVYDAATVNGQSMSNAKSRMAEAYTATCQTCSKITDEGFGYSVRGELSAFYESTPNSGGYYYVPMSYWANGLLETFGPFLTEPQYQVTPDGEGRMGAISDLGYSVPSITYYTSGLPNTLQTSCAGSTCYPITYQYDPNTLRMTRYSAALNGGTISGTLTWNPNGTLQQLVIADPFNSADPQTCTYGADDLSRIASVTCMNGTTTVWKQNFSYDHFGNVTKSGSISWMPGYNSSTNHYALGGTSYDANGNVLNDTFNRYTWDAEGKTVSTAYSNGQTYAFVYDAFGHQVEWSSNGTYEFSRVTLGNFKLSAIGQNAYYSEYPFPGGSFQSENGGATGVQLADWLGTSRAFYSYTGGNWGQSGAHAPFGEAYSYNNGYPKDFTGQQNDGYMNNTTYYFPERQYRSSQGRWLSPDPAGLEAADPSNPQSWNLYAYVLNNPLSATDPLGLDCIYDQGDEGFLYNKGDCVYDSSYNGNGFYFDGTIDPNAVGLNANGDVVANVDSGSGWTTQCSGSSCDASAVSATVNADSDVPIYGLNGQGALILQVAGLEAAHGLGCVGLGGLANSPKALGVMGGTALFKLGQPVPGSKPFITPGSSVGTSPLSEALRDALPQRLPFRVPTLVGGPGTGAPLRISATTSVGAALGRAAPFVGAALTAYSAYKINQCLSEVPGHP